MRTAISRSLEVVATDSCLVFIGVHQHERGKPVSQRLSTTEASAKQRVQSASSTQHMWEGGSWVGVCVPHALSLSFENGELNCCTA